MNKLDLYKYMYYYELDTKEKINTRISSLVAISSIFLGGLGYFATFVHKVNNYHPLNVYFILLLIYFISTGSIIFFTIRTFTGYSYKHFPAQYVREFEQETEEYYDKYEEYFTEKGLVIKELKESHFQEQLIDRFVEGAEVNMVLNERKLRNFRRIGGICIIGAISALLMIAFLVTYSLI